ncbi:MAG: hypothetical protein NTV34_08615, partial [Proteobacteria bacterium]|nr:hypothetical protein [Pseudomonadota bacterium]
MTSFWKNSLSEMWQHRATGDLAQAEICFMDVVSALNLDISLPIKSQIDVLFRQVKRDDRSLIADILMYPAARLRGYYKLSESWLVIREFEEASRPRGLHLSFQFLLQKGLNHLTTGQHTEALCCFKFAERVARSVDETFLARVNSLLMEESLGLNIASVLRKFDSDFRAFCIENKDLSLILKTVKVQYTALRIRQSFLSGDFSELARLTVLSDETRGFAR